MSAPTSHVGSVEKDRVQGFPKHTRGVGLSKWTSFSQNGVESSMSQRKRKTNENSTVCTTEDTRKQKASKAPSPKSTVDNEDMHGSISDIRGDSQEANRTNDKRVSLLTQKGANDAGLALRDCNGLSDAAEDGGPKKSRFECDLMARKAQAIAHCDSLQLKHREVRNSALNQEDLAGARLADAAGEAEMILRDSISSMTQAEFNQFQDDQNPEVHLKEVLATLQKLHAQVKLKYVEADENVDLRSNGTLWLAEVNELDENIKKLQETVSDLKAKNRQDVELSVPDAVQDSRNIRAELVQARSQIEERCKKLEEKYARAKAKRQRRDARLEAATAKGAELEDADKSLAVAKKKISQGNLSREMAARLAANAVAKCKNGKASKSLLNLCNSTFVINSIIAFFSAVMLSSLESEGEIANVGTGHVDNSPPTRNHSQSSTGAHDVPALRKDTRDATNPTAPTSAHTGISENNITSSSLYSSTCFC